MQKRKITMYEVGQAAYRSGNTIPDQIKWFLSQGYIIISK